jgi:hypothetical protein
MKTFNFVTVVRHVAYSIKMQLEYHVSGCVYYRNIVTEETSQSIHFFVSLLGAHYHEKFMSLQSI